MEIVGFKKESKKMDRDNLSGWCIAGACSVAIHVFIILLFAWSGKTPSVPAPQPEPVTAARERTPDQPSSESPHKTAAPASAEPRTQDYKVKPGDNLTRLARNANTTPAELARLNGVDEKELAKLKVGQTIKLPVVD